MSVAFGKIQALDMTRKHSILCKVKSKIYLVPRFLELIDDAAKQFTGK